MSKSEIIQERLHLSRQERREILQSVFEFEPDDLGLAAKVRPCLVLSAIWITETRD
jgi:hypothetical protein